MRLLIAGCLVALSVLHAGIAPAAQYNVYYGHLHNHSSVSDGTGTPASAYSYARNNAGLDFFGLADHAESITSSEWTTIKSAADAANQDGVFVALWGFEWSSSRYGHVTIVGTSDYTNALSTTTFDGLLSWLSTRNGLAFFNHPGRENDFGTEFDHFGDVPANAFVGMELWNKNDDFGVYYYNDGYVAGDGKGYFDEALARGWKIGAAGSDDNHSGTWGTENDFRLAVLAESKTRSAITAALQARRFFTTLDKNLTLSFTVNGAEMGSTLTAAGSYPMVISAGDANGEVFSRIQLISDGLAIQTWTPNTASPVVSATLNAASGKYYYVKVTQVDGDEAISSPIWVAGTPGGGGSSTVTFQQGVGGYASALDTEIWRENPATNLSANTAHSVDGSDAGDPRWTLIRFDGIFGAGLIPQGATITSATLQFYSVDKSSNTVAFHRMIKDWSASSTWNSLVDGVNTDNVEAVASADATLAAPSSGSWKSVNVTASLKAWAANPAGNKGWFIRSNGTDGWDWRSSNYGTASYRPKLTVTYTTN